jgi:hypothetical protein
MARDEMTYTHFQHRHNFAVWCAARAVQRGFAKSLVLKDALEKAGVAGFIRDNHETTLSQQEFDQYHEEWCESILAAWKKNHVKGASYGRAAKLLAVYLKSMIVVQANRSGLSDVAHPPIDRIILHNISKDEHIHHPNKGQWKEINWTQLDKHAYKRLICDFRQVFNGKPFGAIEKYWSISDD